MSRLPTSGSYFNFSRTRLAEAAAEGGLQQRRRRRGRRRRGPRRRHQPERRLASGARRLRGAGAVIGTGDEGSDGSAAAESIEIDHSNSSTWPKDGKVAWTLKLAVVLPYPNTYLQLYQNWHDGVGGLPALSALEEVYGAAWRARGTRGNAFYQRARAIKNLVTTFMPDLAAVANVQRTFYEHHKASTAQAQKHVANIDKMRKYGEFLRQSLPGFAARQAAAKKRKRTQAANKAAKKARRAPGGDGSGGAGAGAGAGARSGSGTDV